MVSMNKKTLITIIVAVLALGGVAAGIIIYRGSNNTASNSNTQSQSQSRRERIDSPDDIVTYQGQDGMTAMRILRRYHSVKTTGAGEDAVVISIDGIEADEARNQWTFSVNGEASTVGANAYETKDIDTITWQLVEL
jgi:hypothetical protein